MDERRRNIAIGLFMLGATICLTVLILLFGQYPTWIGGRTYEVHAYFDEVEYLEEETEVLMLGKRIGWVSNVGFRGEKPGAGIDVTMQIDRSVPIPADAKVLLKEAPMGFGRARLTITIPAGSTAPPVPTDGSAALPGTAVGPFEQVIPRDVVTTLQTTAKRIGELAAALTPAAKDLHDLLKQTGLEEVDAGRAVGNLSTALQRLDAALKHVNDVIGDPETKQQLRQTIANLHQASEQATQALVELKDFAASAKVTAGEAKELTAELRAGVAEARQQFRSIAQRVNESADRLSELLKHLASAASDLSEGKGTAGRLLKDERLYEALVLTTNRLNAALIDLQALIKAWQIEGVKVQSLRLR